MSYDLDCPHCEEEISARRDPQGHRVRCPHCGRMFLWDADADAEPPERYGNFYDRQEGWVGFALIALCVFGLPAVRQVRFPEFLSTVKFAIVIVGMVCGMVGVVISINGIYRGRGEAGGALALMLAVLSLVLFAVVTGFK